MCLCCSLQVYVIPSVLHAVHVVLGDEFHRSSGSGDTGRSIRLLLLDDGQVEPGPFSGGQFSVESSSVSVRSYMFVCMRARMRACGGVSQAKRYNFRPLKFNPNSTEAQLSFNYMQICS